MIVTPRFVRQYARENLSIHIPSREYYRHILASQDMAFLKGGCKGERSCAFSHVMSVLEQRSHRVSDFIVADSNNVVYAVPDDFQRFWFRRTACHTVSQ